jgi:pSer/pThr/pTyr-binding forkhead associated (FHA) protein
VDVLDLAILALRVALVAVLYVFLLLVLRFSGRALQAEPNKRTAKAAGLRLVVVEAGGSNLTTGQVIDVSANPATLGRGEEAEVVIADAAISASHARVARTGRGWAISDLGSTNGTRVNDSGVTSPTALANGDVLALGSVRLKVIAR